ncbi:MAG: response regulator [Desulfobacterales bacterium]|nr:response regulator [Desulfobacterales bacterium]
MEKKILIVDDEPHIRLLLQRTLKKFKRQGVKILVAENGADGLEMIRQEKPDLVFLDVMMPKMNGFDVCSAVKNDLGMDDVYICMLTAKGQEFDKKKGEEVRCNIYMTKPFDPDEIVKKASEVMGI